MDNRLLGEFMGTMVLVLMGDGAVAAVLLRKSKAEGAGWMVIATGWAMAVMAGVFTAVAFGSADAHINPAVTLGMAVTTGDFGKLGPYSVAQLAGAMAGAVLLWLHYLPHWHETPDPATKLACFCTGPAIRWPMANLLSEIIGTFVLVLVVGALFAKAAPVAGLGPYLVGGLVWGIGLSLGGTTGFAINPARDLGARLAHALLPIGKKGGSDWGYAGVPVLGPLIGGALAGALLALVL